MKIARVFPARTKATPNDELAFVDSEPGLFPPDVDEVHVSVTFTWQMDRAEQLHKAWSDVAPVYIGGPAVGGTEAKDFHPGMYLREGYVITSRGCPNRCDFCLVPHREPVFKELPIVDGWNVLDNNLLACSERHIRAVFDMLKRQRGHKVELTGGLEAARLKDWHVDLLWNLRPAQAFFAFDTAADEEPLREASRKLLKAGFTLRARNLRCYVLIRHPKHCPTLAEAERRLSLCLELGFFPMPMLYRSAANEEPDLEWKRFVREWARPAIVYQKHIKKL